MLDPSAPILESRIQVQQYSTVGSRFEFEILRLALRCLAYSYSPFNPKKSSKPADASPIG